MYTRWVRASGRSLSAPVSRASRTCRSDSVSHPASSHSWTDAMVASHIQRSCSIADSSRTECGLRPPQDRHGRLVGVAEQRGQSVEQKVGPARRARRWRRARGLGYLQRASAWPSESPREHRRRQCVQIGLAGKCRIERRQPSSRLEQQRWRIASARGDECCLRAQQRDTCTLEVAEGACLCHGEKAERVIERTCLEFRLRCGKGAPRASRRVRGVSVTAPSRKAAAAAKPPRACARAAERSSSLATSSSGAVAACARCHARRSGSICGSVASASARCASRRSFGSAAPYTAERTSG